MIVALQGNIFKIFEESIWFNVNNVIYQIFCSKITLSELSQYFITQNTQNTSILLFTYQHIREDSQNLFGFLSLNEQELFLNLIKVNGIGPKSAIQILSGAKIEQIIQWIDEGNVKALAQLPKLGKKTAEQLILSLKGKLVLDSFDVTLDKKNISQKEQQIFSALVHLGFKEEAVHKVIKSLPSNVDLETGIRLSLRELSTI